MRMIDRQTAGDAVRLLIFMVVTTLCTGLLVMIIGNITFGGTRDYKAEFLDVTGVSKGDDVRVAGVKVGTVQEIEILDEDGARPKALVSFNVDDDTDVTGATNAQIKFRNIVGQRYIALTQQEGDPGRLEAGATIPEERTHEALDLTVLFNGFKPLFQALTPNDINQLSYEIVQVFQGEGGTLEGLLADTASVTSTLASRDEVIGDLIQNLNTTLVHVADRDEELAELITSFRTLVTGLKNDRDAILQPLDKISQLSVETAGLVSELRPDLVADVKELRRLAGNLDRNKGEIDRVLQVMPIKLTKIGRTATYGSWFNFYLCEFQGRVHVLGNQIPVNYSTSAARCDLG